MKKSRNKDEINPLEIAVTATISTLICAFFSHFGTIYFRNTFGRGPLIGSFLTGFALIYPLFFKKYRKQVWTKSGLLILIPAFCINTAIGIYCSINRYKLFGVIL